MLTKRTGEYLQKGDYHLNLDPNWPYLPVYLEKMREVKSFLDRQSRKRKIIDLGCGEGVLVKEYCRKGFDITGLDLNFKSKYVKKGSLLNPKLPKNYYDIILCLDVIEHLHFHEQKLAVDNMARMLKPGGKLFITIPNLAHFASRFTFLFLGKLIRTSKIERHPGDRPIGEYLKLLQSHFTILNRKGLFPTFPIISALTYLVSSKTILLHRIYNKLFGYPNWCLLNVVVCKKKNQ